MRDGWEVKNLGEVCKLDKVKYSDSELPFVGLEDIQSNAGPFVGDLTPRGMESSTFHFSDVHLLYGRLRPYLNKVMLPTFEGHCSSEIFPLLTLDALDRRYLYYWLTSEPLVEKINQTCTGARMPRANVKEVMEFEIILPPLPEQKRIVAVLDEAFAGIAVALANTEKNLVNARELFETTLHDAFVQKGEGWVEKTLKEVSLDFGRGKSKHRPRNAPFLYGGPYPFIQTGDVRNSGHYIQESRQSYSEAGLEQSKLWPKGTICITIAANIAETGILEFDACFPDSVIGIVVDESKTSNGYVEYALQSVKARLKTRGQGSAQDNINLYSESLKARIFCEYFVDILCWMDSVLVMIRPNFLSAEDRLQLEGCVRRQREDHGIARRANAVLLLDDGESCTQIAKFLYLDDDTIRGWYKAYLEDGWDALAIDGWQGGKSRITLDQEAELCTWLEGRFCRSAGEIRAYIKSRFGPSYSHSGCLKLLRRLGFEYRKPKALPHVADEIKQAEFIAFYEALMNNLPADETVYFADAVHPEHQTKPAFGWVRKGSNPAVKTTTGRGRVNIHGAVCLENFDAPFVEPITVDGNSAVQLLAKIEANNPTMSAIHVIWDNAAYHRCDAVKKWLARPECRIRLIQLPVYCPHLNPIERLWAVMHAHVTHNHFYATQKQFAEAILHFFREIIPKNWRSFRDQVTDNFRIISHQNFRILE